MRDAAEFEQTLETSRAGTLRQHARARPAELHTGGRCVIFLSSLGA